MTMGRSAEAPATAHAVASDPAGGSVPAAPGSGADPVFLGSLPGYAVAYGGGGRPSPVPQRLGADGAPSYGGTSVDIGHGSIAAVDTGTLRDAAARLDGVVTSLEEAAHSGYAAIAAVLTAPGLRIDRVELATDLARSCGEGVASVAERLRHLADVYELMELRISAQLLGLSGFLPGPPRHPHGPHPRPGLSRRAERYIEIRQRMNELRRSNPQAAEEADRQWREWREGFGKEAIAEWTDAAESYRVLPLGVPGIVGDGAHRMIALAGLGLVPAGAVLRGKGDPVAIARLWPGNGARVPHGKAMVAHTVPPATLGEAAKRIPNGDTDARIRVESYTMPNGTKQHAVYLAGTQGGGDDAWDWRSNLDLYQNERSASYNGLEAALQDAGVEPGDVVHEFGFSQGAMVAGRMALEGAYDVQTLATFGSPIDVQGGDGLLNIAVRHTDDVIPVLANGGMPSGGGSPESLVIEAEADPADGPHDLLIPAHRVDEYAETAAQLDGSTDPRLQPLRDLFASLGTAERVTVAEYAVDRVDDTHGG